MTDVVDGTGHVCTEYGDLDRNNRHCGCCGDKLDAVGMYGQDILCLECAGLMGKCEDCGKVIPRKLRRCMVCSFNRVM